MRRALLIAMALVLALVGWSSVCAEDGYYVIPTMRGKYAPVPKTGQTTSHGTRDDGDLQKGVPSPAPRFTDNANGTVTDNLTGLVWMKDAGALGTKSWGDALSAANNLKSGDPGTGLTDGSKAGDWRLPNLRELQSLIDYGRYAPALPTLFPFAYVQYSSYWSSTTYANYAPWAWNVSFIEGQVSYAEKSTVYYVWCVRGGK